MSYSQEWLESEETLKCILVEVYVRYGSVETPIYISNTGYLTADSLTSFMPIITTAMSLTESLSLDGSLSMSFGDIEINNPNGEYDTWLDSSVYIWVNRPIKVYVGDARWQCATLLDIRNTFELIFDGVVFDIDSKSRNLLNIKVRDKLELLNTPISEEVLGTYGTWAGGQTNQDTLLPLIFGEVFNVSPLLIDPATQEYMLTNSSTELLIELRDNGVPIYSNNNTTEIIPMPGTGSIDLSTGKVKLGRALVGTLTASVQGVVGTISLTTGDYIPNQYKNTIANIISIIVTRYGKADASTRLSVTDIDLQNFNSFDINNPQAVGIFINDKANILEVCQQLASSVGAQIFINKKGKLQLLRLGDFVTANTYISTITDSDILKGSLSMSSKAEVRAASKIGYCKNWTTQSGLQTGIPDIHKGYFKGDMLPITIVDSGIQQIYKLNTEPEQKDSLLINYTDSLNEAIRLSNYEKVPKIVYTFTGTFKLFSLVLGQGVTIIHNRFNLLNGGLGKLGQVVSLSPNWSKGTIQVEVVI